MKSGASFGICYIIYSLCLIVSFVLFFFFSAKIGTEAVEKQFFSFSYVNQIGRDWNKEPYTSIAVVNNSTTCPDDHPDVVVYRPWYGNELGCDCLGVSQSDSSYNLEGMGNKMNPAHICTWNQTMGGCRQVEGNPAVIMG